MSKGLGIAAALGLAVGYAARHANVFDGVVREGGVVDFGRLGANLRDVADKVRESVPGRCGEPAAPDGTADAAQSAPSHAGRTFDDDGA